MQLIRIDRIAARWEATSEDITDPYWHVFAVEPKFVEVLQKFTSSSPPQYSLKENR